MDAFSEILSGVKLNGAFYFHAEFSAPWGTISPATELLAPLLCPGVPRLVIYHYVVEGRAYAHIGARAVELGPGDVVVIPHGDEHVMTSEAKVRETRDSAAVAQKVQSRQLTALQIGGGGEKTRFVCGFMACDSHLSRSVLDGLPDIFKINIRSDRSGLWLESSILHLVEEAGSGSVGSGAMLAKLSEALFVDTLRRYAATLPVEQLGWLSGARDPVVGKSLGLMHQRVDYPWTIADLAKEVGLSRSALVERFTKYLAEPPMTYLTRWRLHLAAQSLTRTSKGVAEIAAEVGYESEAAFNRAFKRGYGLPPARYRRERRGETLAA